MRKASPEPIQEKRSSPRMHVLALAIGSVVCSQATATDDAFSKQVRPFLAAYCAPCHRPEKSRGDLDLTRYETQRQVIEDFRQWNSVIEFIRDAEMPPKKAKQPSREERRAVVSTLEDILLQEARRHAGDPGVVSPRRLSNTEFDTSVLHLTGVDLRPTREFPTDPAAGEGFDNTGEALGMSPNLLKKYLAAAQTVATHLVLKPDGLTFASFPVTSYNERKKLTEGAIIEFYERHEVHVEDYLEEAWRYRYRPSDEHSVSIEEWARNRDLSADYLARVWKTLESAKTNQGFLARLGKLWTNLPSPEGSKRPPVELRELESFIRETRRTIGQREENLINAGAGNWPIGHLDFRTKVASRRDQPDFRSLERGRYVILDRLRATREPTEEGAKPVETRLVIEIDAATAQGKSYVLLRRPVFTRSDRTPRDEKDSRKHEVETLRAFLERRAPELVAKLGFGEHAEKAELDADSLIVKTPARLEIPLDEEALHELDKRSLLIFCEHDRERSTSPGAYVRHAVERGSGRAAARKTALLLDRDSPHAKASLDEAARFCETFPNRFVYVNPQRGLAAGFHLVEGFFRDDRPLVEKVLDANQRAELDRLWRELDFVTQSAETLLRGFVWFERAERHVLHDKRFDFLRSEDPALVEEELLGRFERVYLGKMGVELEEGRLEPTKNREKFDLIHGFFERTRKGLATHRALLAEAEARALRDLVTLATRAYARDLSTDEIEGFEKLYSGLRGPAAGLSVEEAARGVFAAILMSPEFLLQNVDTPEGSKVAPLSNHSLARRLSYLLWSSFPDEELATLARERRLREPEVLRAQARRMLRSPKIAVFAREFFGQWLRYRDFLEKDPIQPGAFRDYDDELRRAMFEEPTRVLADLLQRDDSILELLRTDSTFVNERLARHYGGQIRKSYHAERKRLDQDWLRVEGLSSSGRGGLFGMALVLTRNSAGARTSPVKRGFWTAHHLLGEHFPPPPADVPELPSDETSATATIRELLRTHAENERCAICHTQFDGLGLALEGFDPIGRIRTKDLAGRPVDDRATLPNGEEARGIPALVRYVETHRRDDFVRTLCRKFLGYALGRSVILSDTPLLEEMRRNLASNDYRFSSLVETVISSPQFLNRRGRDFVRNP